MTTISAKTTRLFACLTLLLLAGCGGGGGGGGGDNASPASSPSSSGGSNTQYTIGGSVSGLAAGKNVTLRDATSSTTITISANGSYTFPTSVADGTNYSITVSTPPVGQSCVVANGTGNVNAANVSNITVTCTNVYTVGGVVTGLTTGQTAQIKNNGGNAQTISGNSTGSAINFTFSTPIASGSTYATTITQPSAQTCVISNGSGTVGSANVSNIAITCSSTPTSFNVGATVSGLKSGTTLVLQNNGAGNLNYTTNVSKNFNVALTDGSAYAVTVLTQPSGQTCTVTNGSGSVANANVNISVSCVSITYNIGGTVAGLGSGKTVTVQNNAGNATSISANGSFTFSTKVAYAAPYAVTVSTQPAGQTCVVTNGSGTTPASNVANVTVSCSTTASYTISATVSGLASSTSLVMQSNAGSNITAAANGTYTFGTSLNTGAAYSLTVFSQPSGQTCTPTSTSGTVASGNINVAVSCTANTTSADLCSGVAITDKRVVSYTNIAKPARGASVIDPDFGTTIRRITDVATQWPGSTTAVPAYPTIPAWNADETYLLLYVTQPFKGWALLNGKTYAFIRMLNINPADVEQFYWSTTNPDIIFYVDQNTYTLERFHVSTNTVDHVHNFAPDIASGVLKNACSGFDLVSGGSDPFFMSYDNDLIGLGCRKTGGANTTFNAFSYRISTNTIGTVSAPIIGIVPQATPSGTTTYLADGTSSSNSHVLNPTTNATIRTVAWNGEEHSDMMKNAAGNDLVVGVQYDSPRCPSGGCSGTLIAANLSTGTVTAIIGEEKGDPYPPTGTLVSGKAYQKPGWVAVATTGNGLNKNNPAATYLTQEIMLANVDTGKVCRLAHHRSFGYDANSSNQNYWAQPNVILSPRGTRILFPSDWYLGSTVDTYVIELPTYVP